MHTLTLKRVLGFTIVILLLLALFIWGIGLETLKARQVDLLYLGQRHLMLVFTSMFLLYWSVSRVGFYSAVLRQKDLLNMSCKSLMLVIPCRHWPSALAMVIIGIGDTPAIVALFLASLLPIVRNTYAGLCSVPASLIEAANGIGMTKWQRLRQVELPNAWPVMLSGIRIATAINVGTAPLAFLIGASSYGELIFPGIYLNDFPTLILGATATALFALILDTLLAWFGRRLGPHTV